MLCYWAKIVSTDNAKLTSMLYRLLYIKLVNEGILCPWMDFVRNQLNFCGIGDIWVTQFDQPINITWFKTKINTVLKDQYLQKWRSDMNDSSKGQYYRISKENLEFEKYLDI